VETSTRNFRPAWAGGHHCYDSHSWLPVAPSPILLTDVAGAQAVMVVEDEYKLRELLRNYL
jgi:hypothetical protein